MLHYNNSFNGPSGVYITLTAMKKEYKLDDWKFQNMKGKAISLESKKDDVYTVKYTSGNYKGESNFVIKDGISYLLNYEAEDSAYRSNLDLFNKIKNS